MCPSIASDFAVVSSILVDGTCAWQPPELIARHAGWDLEDCLDRLCDLDVAGLISVWCDRDPEPLVVTLTPLGAGLLGVRLVESTHHELYRWSADAATARTRRASRAQLKRMEDHDALLREIPAREPAPSRAPRPRRTEPQRPTVLLWGHGGWPWHEAGNHSRKTSPLCPECWRLERRMPQHLARVCTGCGRGVAARPRPPVCPGCKGERLDPDWYCLRCDRWGRDGHYARRSNRRTD
jgi:hypothetical protein